MEQRWVCLVRPPLAAHLVVGVAMLAGEGVVDSYKTLLAGESLDVRRDGIGLGACLIRAVLHHVVAIAKIVALPVLLGYAERDALVAYLKVLG